MVEEARLESVYTPKVYPGFESPSLRRHEKEKRSKYNSLLAQFNLLRLKMLLQQNKLNNKLLLPLKLLLLLLLLQKKVVFTRKSKLNSSKVLHLS